jgi:hypothetical protein
MLQCRFFWIFVLDEKKISHMDNFFLVPDDLAKKVTLKQEIHTAHLQRIIQKKIEKIENRVLENSVTKCNFFWKNHFEFKNQ